MNNEQNKISSEEGGVEIKTLKEKIAQNDKTIKQIAQMARRFEVENTTLKEQLNSKEKECQGYIEKIKIMEKKTDEVYKNVTKGNMSDLNEIKKQFEKEKLILNELIKTYKNGIDEKTDILRQQNEEITKIRNYLDEERKKNETLITANYSKYDQKSLELQFHKISSENSSLRSKLLNSDEKVEKLLEQVEALKNENSDMEKNFTTSLDLIKKELSFKENSYKTLIKDYQNTLQTLTNTQDTLEKANYFNQKYENDFKDIEKKYKICEKDVISLSSENEGFKSRMKGQEIELESLRRKVRESEAKLAEYKLSRQVFNVTYSYMRMSISAHIIMQKEGEIYQFLIENSSGTRKFSYLDVDMRKDDNDINKVIVKIIKLNTEEEFFTNEAVRMLEMFTEFKKRVIEVTDFSKVNITEKENVEKKVKQTEKKLKNFLEI
jgi:chromosome segregation ATPase